MEDGDGDEAGCGARTHQRRAALPREYCRTQMNSVPGPDFVGPLGPDPEFVGPLGPDPYFVGSLGPDPTAITITFNFFLPLFSLWPFKTPFSY